MSAPMACEMPPTKCLVGGTEYSIVRFGRVFSKAPSRASIVAEKVTWMETTVVARPNASFDASTDPEGRGRLDSMHILFVEGASSQTPMSLTQVDAVSKATNVAAGGPALKPDPNLMPLAWQGQTVWVQACGGTKRSAPDAPSSPAPTSRPRREVKLWTAEAFEAAGVPDEHPGPVRYPLSVGFSKPPTSPTKTLARHLRDECVPPTTTPTWAETTQVYLSFLANAPDVPMRVKQLVDFHTSVMRDHVAAGTHVKAPSKFVGHLFTTALGGAPEVVWDRASLQAHANKLGDKSAFTAAWRAQTGLFHNLFFTDAAAPTPVDLMEL